MELRCEVGKSDQSVKLGALQMEGRGWSAKVVAAERYSVLYLFI